MEKLSDINNIRKILKEHNFKFSHSLGQNFIINPEICPKMAELSKVDENTGVIEIGPGIGVLTNELAKRAKKVVSIEIDRRLLSVLNETLSEFSNVKVLNADILKINLKELIREEFNDVENIVVCANLPYYITSPVIMKLLEGKLRLKSIVAMVQKEVAERICAGVGTRESSNITVTVNYYSKPEILFPVSKADFMPSPKVDSAVIKLDINNGNSVKVKDEEAFFKVVKSVFLQRRKTILNSLSKGLNLDKVVIEKVLSKLGLDINLRAENLTMEQFISLANYIYEYVE